MIVVRLLLLLLACCTSVGARATVYPFDQAQLKVDVGNALSADKKPTWLVVEKGVSVRMQTDDRSGPKNAMLGFGNFNGRSGLLFRIDNMGSVCIADVVRDSREVIIGPTPTTFTLSNFRKQGPGGPCTSVGGAPRVWEGQVTLATVDRSGQLTMDVSLTGSTERSKPLAYHVSNLTLPLVAALMDDGSAAREVRMAEARRDYQSKTGDPTIRDVDDGVVLRFDLNSPPLQQVATFEIAKTGCSGRVVLDGISNFGQMILRQSGSAGAGCPTDCVVSIAYEYLAGGISCPSTKQEVALRNQFEMRTEPLRQRWNAAFKERPLPKSDRDMMTLAPGQRTNAESDVACFKPGGGRKTGTSEDIKPCSMTQSRPECGIGDRYYKSVEDVVEPTYTNSCSRPITLWFICFKGGTTFSRTYAPGVEVAVGSLPRNPLAGTNMLRLGLSTSEGDLCPH